jgi:predicted DCC family thiol-disulfide oxidoreductase YuxK
MDENIFAGRRLILLFDGYCGFCTRQAEWVQAHDVDKHVLVLPNQKPGVREALGLRKAEVDRAAWTLINTGERCEGAAAINRVLRELPGWGWLAIFYTVPPLRWMEDAVYQWIANNRQRFARWGAMPECERPGADCVPEGK